MACKVLDAGGALRTITALKVRDNGVTRTILRMKVMDTGDTLRTVAVFAGPLSLTAVPPSTGIESFSANVLTAPPVTATPSGGLGPYTYAWTVISGTATINSPTSATTDFTSPTLTPDAITEATVRCTCTDSSGQSATVDVQVTWIFYNPF